jgi:fatty-acyl-CoA synthase
MYEAHFGVPMAGAVLNTLNTRLDHESVAFQLGHGEARILLVDGESASVAERATAQLSNPPFIIDIEDSSQNESRLIGEKCYEQFLLEGDEQTVCDLSVDELDAISLSYTSGTTGDPKGVVTHHRGAYLNSLSQVLTWGMPTHAVYLWTLPMFHCNGWCFPWSVAAVAGTNICLRKVLPIRVFDAIKEHGVTHMCGAPIVYNMLIEDADRLSVVLPHRVNGMVAGASPPAATIESAERLGIDLTHVYGLTEVYGPAAVCAKKSEWNQLSPRERARLNARQGVASLMQDSMTVLAPESLEPVPNDGLTIGEIMFRGNTTMSGYLKNPVATEAALAGGWFHTGDLAVVEPDGYVRITDRSKDVIISGGENVSSIEIEDVLHRHPAVTFAAVVAKPDEKWGEVPCAFVELRANENVTSDELSAFCRENLAAFKIPKHFIFGEIQRTSTGKVQKFLLRNAAKRLLQR